MYMICIVYIYNVYWTYVLDNFLPIPDTEYPASYLIGIKASCVWT